jgi:hypothetical protein
VVIVDGNGRICDDYIAVITMIMRMRILLVLLLSCKHICDNDDEHDCDNSVCNLYGNEDGDDDYEEYVDRSSG